MQNKDHQKRQPLLSPAASKPTTEFTADFPKIDAVPKILTSFAEAGGKAAIVPWIIKPEESASEFAYPHC